MRTTRYRRAGKCNSAPVDNKQVLFLVNEQDFSYIKGLFWRHQSISNRN